MDIQLMAGSISSLIFMMGSLTMVIRAWRTRDMQSYSAAMLILNNIGNIIYWVYLLSLPLGPVHVLQAFYTVTTVFMLVWWVLYHKRPETAERITSTMRRMIDPSQSARQTDSMEFPRPQL